MQRTTLPSWTTVFSAAPGPAGEREADTSPLNELRKVTIWDWVFVIRELTLNVQPEVTIELMTSGFLFPAQTLPLKFHSFYSTAHWSYPTNCSTTSSNSACPNHAHLSEQEALFYVRDSLVGSNTIHLSIPPSLHLSSFQMMPQLSHNVSLFEPLWKHSSNMMLSSPFPPPPVWNTKPVLLQWFLLVSLGLRLVQKHLPQIMCPSVLFSLAGSDGKNPGQWTAWLTPTRVGHSSHGAGYLTGSVKKKCTKVLQNLELHLDKIFMLAYIWSVNWYNLE